MKGLVIVVLALVSVLATFAGADDDGFLDFFEKRHGHPHEARHHHAARGHSSRHHAARHGHGHAAARGHPHVYECPPHCCGLNEETVVSENYPDQEGGESSPVPEPTSSGVPVTYTTILPADSSSSAGTTVPPPTTGASKRHGHGAKARHGSQHAKRHHF